MRQAILKSFQNKRFQDEGIVLTKPAVLLPIETTSRELMYKLVLAAKFAESGFDAYVGAKEEIYKLFKYVKPFIYFDKGYHKGVSEQIYADVKKHGGLIASLDEEGGVDFKDMSTISSRYPEVLFEQSDVVFLWGKAQYEFLSSRTPAIKEKNVIISGHPRFELLKQKYQEFYAQDVEELKKEYGRYVLVCTNMGFGNNVRGDDFVRTNYSSRVRSLEQIISFDKEKLNAFICMIKKFSDRTAFNIIVRPHPEENHSVWHKELGALPNVHIVYRDSVIPWIIASEMMIHPDCTTGIESCIMGKEPVSYLPRFDEDLCPYLPVEVSKKFTEEEHVVDFLADQSRWSSLTGKCHTLLEDYFAISQPSFEKIVHESKLILSAVCQPRGIKKAAVFKETCFSILKQFARRTDSDKLISKKRAGLDKESVFKLVAGLYAQNNCPDVATKSLWKNLYKITCRS